MVKAKKRFTSKKKPIAKRSSQSSAPRRVAPKKKVTPKNDLVEIEEPVESEKVEQAAAATPSHETAPAQTTPLSKDVASLDEFNPSETQAVSTPPASTPVQPVSNPTQPVTEGVTSPTPQSTMPEVGAPAQGSTTEAKPLTEGDLTQTASNPPATTTPLTTTFTPIETSLESTSSPHRGKKLLILAFIILFLLLFSAGAYYYMNYMNVGKKASNVVATVTETPLPSNTPTPAESTLSAEMLSPYQVQVLNGSGVAGEANRVADSLEDIGFEDIARGNAPAYSSDDTEVAMKEETPKDVFRAIEKVLKENYTVVEADENLAETSKYDVVVTVGSKTSEE